MLLIVAASSLRSFFSEAQFRLRLFFVPTIHLVKEMKFYSLKLASILVVAWIASAAHIAANELSTPDLSPDKLWAQSDYWPDRVKLTVATDVPGGDKPLPAGWAGVLARVEQDGVLLDFGRDGVFKVALENTNILQLAEQIRLRYRDSQKLRMDLLTSRMYAKFFHDVDGVYKPTLEEDFYKTNYFLFSYYNFSTDLPSSSIDYLIQQSPVLEQLRVSLVAVPLGQTEKELIKSLRALKWPYACMFHWLVPYYIKSMAHPSQKNGYSVLTDSNGRIVSHGPTLDLLKSIKETVDSDWNNFPRVFSHRRVN